MAETGIEDLIENGPDGTGCLVSIGFSVAVIVVLCVIIGLVGSYCGSSPAGNSNSNVSQQK